MFVPTLEAWKHFVPVKPDLSDLEEQAKYALHKDNEAQMNEIIQNANQWCQDRLVSRFFAHLCVSGPRSILM